LTLFLADVRLGFSQHPTPKSEIPNTQINYNNKKKDCEVCVGKDGVVMESDVEKETFC